MPSRTWATLTVKKILLFLGYHIRPVGVTDVLIPLLYSLMQKKGHLTFVQIGANDGKANDPLYEFIVLNHKRLTGVCVEPLKDFYEKLKGNYANFPGIIPVNLAIHNSEKEIELYRVDPAKLSDLPSWAGGMGSFDLDFHKLSGTPSDCIITERVKCISLAELLQQHQIAEFDLLQIDTEGYDSEIIYNIDYSSISPLIIRFEHGVSGGVMTETELTSLIRFLQDHGYETTLGSEDATACKRSLFIP